MQSLGKSASGEHITGIIRRAEPRDHRYRAAIDLRITKQSLSRVLSELVRLGFVTQRPGTRDRRQRLLELTEKGVELERQLSEN